MKSLSFVALTAAGVFWGLGFPLGKLGLRETDASNLIFLRFLVAAIAGAPFVLLRADTRALFRSPLVLVSGVINGVAFLLQYEGLKSSSVTVAALLVGLMPAMIALSAPFLGERVGRLSWVGVAAATVGAIVIAGRPGDAASPVGVSLMLLSLLIFLAWLMIFRKISQPRTAMALPAATMIIGCLTVLPLTLVLHGAPKFDLSTAGWAAVVGQGVLSTFLATACWQFGLRHVGSAAAGVFVNIEPLMGAAIGVMMFGDRLTAGLVFGGALIVLGSVVVVFGERAPEAITPA